MEFRLQLFSILVGVILLGIIFQLIRKNRLLEQYSLLWIASAVILIVMAVWQDLWVKISSMIGILYPPSTLFLVAIICGMVIALHFSVVISGLKRQNNKLAQEMGLLRGEMERLKHEKGIEQESAE
jgi:hypothetical protein